MHLEDQLSYAVPPQQIQPLQFLSALRAAELAACIHKCLHYEAYQRMLSFLFFPIGIFSFCAFVQLEDQLSYAAPPRQAPHLRHCLTHVLERTENPKEAEVFSQEALRRHPNNPWGQYALLESLKKQNRSAAEQQQVQRQLDESWQWADRPIKCPCPIFVVW